MNIKNIRPLTKKEKEIRKQKLEQHNQLKTEYNNWRKNNTCNHQCNNSCKYYDVCIIRIESDL